MLEKCRKMLTIFAFRDNITQCYLKARDEFGSETFIHFKTKFRRNVNMLKKKIFEIVSEMDNEQCQVLEKYLNHQLYVDAEDVDCRQQKSEIYQRYATTVAELIAKVEVYKHNLPRQISGMVEAIFRILTTASGETEKEYEIDLYNNASEYEDFLIEMLYLMLIEIYIKEAKQYRKVFKKFKYQAIKTEDGILFMDAVDNKLRNVSKFYKQGGKKFRQKYGISYLKYRMLLNKESFITKNKDFSLEVTIKKSADLPEIIQAFELGESVVGICEENYSKIINNGYNSTFINRIINIMPTIVSTMLAIMAAIVIYKRLAG